MVVSLIWLLHVNKCSGLGLRLTTMITCNPSADTRMTVILVVTKLNDLLSLAILVSRKLSTLVT